MGDLYSHICSEVSCCSYGQRTTPRSCRCHKTREQMMTERIEELRKRAETAEMLIEHMEVAYLDLAARRTKGGNP